MSKKPKTKQEAWLFKHFEDPRGENIDMTDRDVREAKRLYKRKRNKMLRAKAKEEIREEWQK